MSRTGNYRLIADIDARSTQRAGNEFQPIGKDYLPFSGTFDGNGHTINGLKVAPYLLYTGMFGYAWQAIIEDVRLTNVSVTGYGQTGALVGAASASSITSCYVTGTVTGSPGSGSYTGPWDGVGLVVGTAYDGTTLSRIHASGTLNGRVREVGGVVGKVIGGESQRVTMTEAFANVTINPTFVSGTGPVAAGGLIGVLINGEVRHVLTTGNILGTYSGGLIGDARVNTAGFLNSIVREGVTHAVVTVNGVSGRAGAIGHYDHDDALFNCTGILYNTTTDTGVLPPGFTRCQWGESATRLKTPHGPPNPVYDPYIHGMPITNPSDPRYPGGSDGIWDLSIWNHNSSTQYSTLRNIPEPSGQPLL